MHDALLADMRKFCASDRVRLELPPEVLTSCSFLLNDDERGRKTATAWANLQTEDTSSFAFERRGKVTRSGVGVGCGR